MEQLQTVKLSPCGWKLTYSIEQNQRVAKKVGTPHHEYYIDRKKENSFFTRA